MVATSCDHPGQAPGARGAGTLETIAPISEPWQPDRPGHAGDRGRCRPARERCRLAPRAIVSPMPSVGRAGQAAMAGRLTRGSRRQWINAYEVMLKPATRVTRSATPV